MKWVLAFYGCCALIWAALHVLVPQNHHPIATAFFLAVPAWIGLKIIAHIKAEG